ncbi:hypothetical protein Tco_1501018 [Tanacetum coccineum]
MRTCALYPKRDSFTPLTKTSKEILAMESIGFPPPPPLVGTPEKQKEVVASGKLAHLVKVIRRGNQRNGGQGRGNVKVINMLNAGGSCKRPYETGRPGLTEENSFPPIPWNSLTGGPIILEGAIEGYQVRRIYVDGESSSKIISHGNHGRSRKEKNCATRIAIKKCHSPYNAIMGRTIMRSLRAVDRRNANLVEGNAVASAHGTNVSDKGTSHTAKYSHGRLTVRKGARDQRRNLRT